MRRCLQQILLSAALLAASMAGHAASSKPQEVRDLHYGEVLFHFYQQDYFTAITNLMVAREQQRLDHHADESELLLGGLQLSYGLVDEAENRFRTLLDENTDRRLGNRIWYYLTKISYQRGNYRQAVASLQEINKPRDKTMRAELAILDANTSMALGRNQEAAETLRKNKAPDGWKEYLQINRGIALLRAGEIEEGRKTLDKLGRRKAGSEELRALRDRANLGLGYELLRAGDATQARDYLERVRLSGPYMQAALLGAGWADAESGKLEQALTPWLELLKLPGYEPPVQEAHLAVPYAFARLGERQRAVHFYEQAIGYFDEEQQQLDAAIESARSGAMLALLSQADTGVSGGWLHDNPTLDNVPAGRYLVEVLSGNDFQERLKDYRDLGYLQQLLGEKLDSIEIYYDMVDARRLAYQERAPLIRARLEKQEAENLATRWQDYKSQLESQVTGGDPLGLANGKEMQQWQTLNDIQDKLASMPAEPRFEKIRDRARWLQGVLYWKLDSDYKTRLWQVNKELRDLESPINESLGSHRDVQQALEQLPLGFEGYDQRIAAMRERILALQPKTEIARAEAADELTRMALVELDARKQRLVSYRSQARYALARSYDQLAKQTENHP